MSTTVLLKDSNPQCYKMDYFLYEKVFFVFSIGADFRTKEIEVDNKPLVFQIWDTAGQERFRALGAPFYRGANACVIAFDVTDTTSFEALSSWREEFLAHCDYDSIDSMPFFVIGNKCDLDGQRKVSSNIVRDLIKKEWTNTTYLETSAKTGEGVTALFEQIAKKCFALMPRMLRLGLLYAYMNICTHLYAYVHMIYIFLFCFVYTLLFKKIKNKK
ncbi:Ras family domain-containing protein [Reticulomyxa filosa]|uniref:Ras family domain-containing protein n=1 Tax=Reticulomyxa filosa TaxID=46433 RepID=X6NAF7_RETFI|nr:Ras family domain-containing protein [Reticulomyxa filosa]|eukprot:ETO23006.1 Ras family domain-containing protein [Reticulomyxa filosa]